MEPQPINVSEVIDRLRVIKLRLSKRVKEMEARYRELFEQVVKAHMEKDQVKAAIYAEELAELRKILRRLTHASLLLEGVTYRLDAVKDLSDASSIMAPLRDVLTVASSELSGIAPTASDELRKLINSVEDLSIRVGYVSEPGGISTELSEEAKKILEEASAIAAQRNREKGKV